MAQRDNGIKREKILSIFRFDVLFSSSQLGPFKLPTRPLINSFDLDFPLHSIENIR